MINYVNVQSCPFNANREVKLFKEGTGWGGARTINTTLLFKNLKFAPNHGYILYKKNLLY